MNTSKKRAAYLGVAVGLLMCYLFVNPAWYYNTSTTPSGSTDKGHKKRGQNIQTTYRDQLTSPMDVHADEESALVEAARTKSSNSDLPGQKLMTQTETQDESSKSEIQVQRLMAQTETQDESSKSEIQGQRLMAQSETQDESSKSEIQGQRLMAQTETQDDSSESEIQGQMSMSQTEVQGESSESGIQGQMSMSQTEIQDESSESEIQGQMSHNETQDESSESDIPPVQEQRIKSQSQDERLRTELTETTKPDKRAPLKVSSLPKDLYELAKNVFDKLPEEYLSGYKSPCFMMPSIGIRCLPYFYLLGMPKCGTTDVWAKIEKHPSVKGSEKEPHWWARHRLRRVSFQWYLSHSKKMVKRLAMDPSHKSSLVYGDGSASTFWDNARWRSMFGTRYDGPKYVTADIMHAAQPDARLIVTLRNPVDRVYSGYLFFNARKRSLSPQNFHSLVVKVIQRFNECLNELSYRACAYSINELHNQNVNARLLVGLYGVFVEDWLRVFPRDQLKVIRLEDWHYNCTGMLPEIHDFLDLEKQNKGIIEGYCSSKTRNTNVRRAKNAGPMLPETRTLLEEFYAKSNADLSEILKDDRFLWKS